MNENGVTAEEGDEAAEAQVQPTEEQVKIVVIVKGGRGSVGLQKPDCDPVFSLIEGDLGEVVANIPRLIDEARAKWDANAKYPKCEANLAPPPPQARAASPPAAHAPASKAQPAMF